ncbi:MAG: TIGR04211 family SH3 domain-containing protein [Pseudomonadota bacterium]|nr:TIGR04211 family SH3 domain-containing protein [Pseudomonadota bacterium]
MKRRAALLLALLAARGASAATAYVSDELVLGVYAEENNQGQRLATLHSGARVETLLQNGDFTQVRLSDGTTGWVRSAFLITKEPAVVRVKQLEEELDRTRATTPALAEAAARSEVERLKQELASKQSELEAARSGTPIMAAPSVGTAAASAPAFIHSPASRWVAIAGIATATGLCCGFWLGYTTLARRIRAKFGGLKVY